MIKLTCFYYPLSGDRDLISIVHGDLISIAIGDLISIEKVTSKNTMQA